MLSYGTLKVGDNIELKIKLDKLGPDLYIGCHCVKNKNINTHFTFIKL